MRGARAGFVIENEYSTVVTAPIEIDDNGVAWLAGTRIKVIEVALDYLAHGGVPKKYFFSTMARFRSGTLSSVVFILRAQIRI